MSILISGSVAFDTIIQTVGKFQDFQAETEDLHLSLFSPLIRREYGGTAANIAYSLAQIGKYSHIIASVWDDGKDYLSRMQDMWINTDLIQMIPWSYCPQAYIIRDSGSGQINTFHPGAMSASGELTHGKIAITHAIVSPDSKEWMIRRVNECSDSGVFTIFDPGQAMWIFSWEELTEMVVKSKITIMNEPERTQFQTLAGVDFVELSKSSGNIAIVTLGEKWATLISDEEITIPAIYVHNIVDATGCGDAFRAGLLYGLTEWWDMEKCMKLGNILGGIKIWSMGWQNHSLDPKNINTIGEKEFGEKFFD